MHDRCRSNMLGLLRNRVVGGGGLEPPTSAVKGLGRGAYQSGPPSVRRWSEASLKRMYTCTVMTPVRDSEISR